ncbi:Putative calcium-dependent channel, 7TM region phosphate [Septoria linicola]|uniref:Calcium-dependent channel, 7TM region phosphate n=1 Tax=Septoria linicola TaxID=215465 RepID=A0A9Q9B252_9PEZI|nr:Putative calcium-dependent channel, 7TM region phosphate [Septoria linicola]
MASTLHEATRVFARQAAASQSGGNTGSNRSSGSSLSGLVSTLIPTLLISVAIFVAFLIFRKRYRRVYQPRSYIESLRNWQKSPEQTAGLLGWKKQFSSLKDEFVLGHASIDNYLWLRFFRMLCVMCLVGCIITWPILFPVNATGTAPDINGLDILSFSHITPGPRYYAQVFVSWLFLAWVMFMITRELKFFTHLRHQYYNSPYMRHRISTRTVLFVDLAEGARSEDFMRREYPAAKKIWLVTVPEDLAEKVQDRDKAAAKLETGTIKLIQTHIKNEIKKDKKAKKSGEKETPASVEAQSPVSVDKKSRPTHRLPLTKAIGLLPLGKKVDTIDWSRSQLKSLIPQVASEQNGLRERRGHAQPACFIEFDSVRAAEAAMRGPASKNEKAKSKVKAQATPKDLGPTPENIIWKNTIKPFWKVKAFNAAGTAFIWFLCIFWTIPVAVIGAISNINYLTDRVSFLSFINSIPPVILGVVTGLLPVVLLAVLMALVPIICTIIAKMFEPTQSAVQMKVQSWYFPFQVIQVFLITTFASGAASVATTIINDPTMAPSLLAQNLPKASNFYISYFILFGLLQAALQFLNIVPLLFVLILGKILDKTPRKMYNRYVNLAGLGWGSLYAKFTNLGVIALSYSSIAPLLLGFATIGFFLLYLGFRYNALFTLGTNVSTRGASYARAMQQLTTGIYLSEVCLIGLFAIGVGSNTQSVGPLVLMIIFLVVTILWHIWLNRMLSKLEIQLSESESFHEIEQHDLEKAHDTTESGNGAAMTSGQTASRGGLMDRVKGYLHADNAATDVIRSLSPTLSKPGRPYTEEEYNTAYIHPAIISECPTIWLARDKFGLSKQEMNDSRTEVGEGLEMTDEGAVFNEKGKIEWNQESIRDAPIYEDEPAY